MPATSFYYSVLQGVQTVITNLNLVNGQVTPAVAVRKLPKAEENIDTLPLIAVVPSEDPEVIELLDFTGTVDVGYLIEVVIIAGSGRDFVTNEDVYLQWREKIRRSFQDPTQIKQQVNTIYRCSVHPNAPFDRRLLNQNYDYSGLTLFLHSLESRDN